MRRRTMRSVISPSLTGPVGGPQGTGVQGMSLRSSPSEIRSACMTVNPLRLKSDKWRGDRILAGLSPAKLKSERGFRAAFLNQRASPLCEINLAQEKAKVSEIDDGNLSRYDNVIFINKDKDMDDALHAQDLFRYGFPLRRHGSAKAAIYAGYRYLQGKVRKEFTLRRARSIWEGSARRIDSEEMDALRLAVIEEDRREQRELRARLAALDERLAVLDEEFFGETLAALRAQTRGQGAPYRRQD